MKNTRILGIAFLFQFCTSLIGNAAFKARVLFADDASRTMSAMVDSPVLFWLFMALSVCTAFGVMFLGYMLFDNLKTINKPITAIAFGLYVAEGLSLLVGLWHAWGVFQLAQAPKDTALMLDAVHDLLANAELFGSGIHMLLFCIGALLFYACLVKSPIMYKAVSWWGLACLPFLLLFTILGFFNITVSFIFYLPYVPFELVIGVLFLVKKTEKPAATVHAA